MFWRFGGYANISTLDTILDKPDVTVEELLDESDLIQELKQQNGKLIEFLRDEPVLKKLLTYVVADKPLEGVADEKKETDAKQEEEKPVTGISFFGKGKARSRSKSVTKKDADGETEQEKRESQRKKYAYVACEVLSSDVWTITEAVLEQRDHLREFWQYMHRPAPLDPLQAGYFTKVNEALMDKKTEDMLGFFKSLDGILPAMLQHVDCPTVMDLLLKIISLEKHEGGAGIVDWLQSQDLISLLLGYLSPEHNSATQTSAGDFLKAIITISANATTQDQSVIGPNELTRELVSGRCIQILIADMLRGGNPLTVGVGIIIEVIRKNNSDYDLDNQVGPEPKTSDPIYLGTLLREFANHVPDFMHLIRSPSANKPGLKSAFGTKIEPLGFDRFKTCELMAELLHCSNMGLLNERGAEQEVRKRDLERQRLKAEGKLVTPKAPNSPNGNGQAEFGSSVDSHGFHHAERPSGDEMSDKSEERHKLEVHNASDEDGFEKVTLPSADDLPDEVSFDEVDEKVAHVSALDQTDKQNPASPQHQPLATADIPRPLSPTKKSSQLNQTLHFDPPPTQAAADSPTTAGVTDRVATINMDEDTVMTEFGEEPAHLDDEGPSELEHELAGRPEDKPPPLFARQDDSDADPIHGTPHLSDGEEQQDVDRSVATIQGTDGAVSNGERAPYETELDGSPVVGDMLKIRFVEHHVVATILDFFFRFPWNNFLHNVVYDVVQQVFNGTLDRGYNRTLAFDLFKSITPPEGTESIGLASLKDVTDRILDGQRASDESQQNKGMRLGYMGHLTLIAEEVCKFGNRHPPDALDQKVLDRVQREEWIQYVEGTLADTRERDNAVLGGVRPENAVGLRSMGMGGGGIQGPFSANTANTLANAGIGSGVTAQDSLAMSEGTVGQAFEINAGTMLSGFGEGDDDEEMEDENPRERRGSGSNHASPFSEDEQASPESKIGSSSIPPPLNIPPSRARRQLAARLAARRKEAEGADADPDATDHMALATASTLPEEPDDIDLGPATQREIQVAGLQISGLEDVGSLGQPGASRFSGLFGSDDSSDEDSSDEEEAAAEDEVIPGQQSENQTTFPGSVERRRSQRTGSKDQRPVTTEAKQRRPLDDDDDDDEDGADLGTALESRLVLDVGEGPFADPVDIDDEDSSEDELVEIRPRRTS